MSKLSALFLAAVGAIVVLVGIVLAMEIGEYHPGYAVSGDAVLTWIIWNAVVFFAGRKSKK